MKTAFITGATSGFGRAIAENLSHRGYRIIIAGRREDRLSKIAQMLEAMGSKVHLLKMDVRDKGDVIAAIKSLPRPWKKIDILINNAGLALGKEPISSGNIEDWDAMIDTNLKGLLYVTRAVLPYIKKSKEGHIINIGSIAGTEVYPNGNVYCASKHAVDALSKALRMELVHDQIRVSQIRPGLADTEFSLVRFKGNKNKAKSTYIGYQALMAEDIANITQFIIESPAHVCINDIEITPTAQANATIIHKNN